MDAGAQRVSRRLLLAALPFALGGCLARPQQEPTTQAGVVATVPDRLFTATVAAVPPDSLPPGRYTLGDVSPIDPADPAVTYAVAVLGANTRGLRLTLRADGLTAPAPPQVNYELVTNVGVFRPLADGEWDRAVAQGGGWSATGTLIFIVPRDLRAGQLAIVDYYYPQPRPELRATPGPVAPLVRRVISTFPLERLP